MKYNTGDIVTIKKALNGHQFKIGQKVRITQLINEHGTDPHYEAKSLSGKVRWWIEDEEL